MHTLSSSYGAWQGHLERQQAAAAACALEGSSGAGVACTALEAG